MVEREWVRRVVGGWAAMTLCFGVAAIVGEGEPEPDVVSVASTGGDDEPTATTAVLRPRPATTTTVPAASPPATEAPEAATATTEPAPVETTVPDTTVPSTTIPPQPTYSMSKHEIVVSQMPVEYIWTAGTGCTGPGHVDDEYGVVGTVYYADGTPWSSGDRVTTDPGTGDWISNMWMANPGSYLHGYACTLLDGTVVFEYARQPFTVVP